MPSEQYRPANKTVVSEIKGFVTDAVRKVNAFRATSATSIPSDSPVTTQDVNVGDSGFQISDISKLVGISSTNSFIIELTQTKTIETYPEEYDSGSFEGSPVEINPGQSIDIVLTDEDLTVSQIGVVVTNLDTGEVENVTLYRQGSTHTYTRTLLTIDSGVTGTDDDQNLHVSIGDSVQISYSDAANDAGNPETITHDISVVAVPTFTGLLKLDDAFTLGSTLKVQLYDADLAGNGTANVSVFNQRSTQTENLILTETATLGLFDFDLPTADDATLIPDDSGVMNVQAGDGLVGTYIDAVNSSGLPETINTNITAGTVVYNTGVVEVIGDLKIGNPITLRVTDPDMATNVNISVVNQSTNEIETVLLSEITPLSGIFEGQITTTIGEDIWYAGTNDDGDINVKSGDVLRVTYNDPIASTGLPYAVVETVVMLDPDPAPPGPTPIITTEDHTVTMTVKGLFYINGEMPDTVINIKKTTTETEELIRCNLIVV